jgi:uncharacterized protein (DUF1684 family)
VNRFENLRRVSASGAALLAATAVCWVLAAEAATSGIGECAVAYNRCLAAWKSDRLGKLQGDDGYLNLAGLFWLRNGVNTFGSGADNDLEFPAAAASDIGSFVFDGSSVVMTVRPGLDVRIAGESVREVRMADDGDESPTVVNYGSFAWTIIRRADRFAVRLRDFAHPALSAFPPIEYYPTDESLRVTAKLKRYEQPRVVRVDTVVEGLDYNPSSPGLLQFEIAGQPYELEAYDAGGELLIVFGDATTGRGTYPAGRFLYAGKPGADGATVLDFNTAQNPPCAFNEFATCPVASRRNRLAIGIAAGERYDPSVH